MKPDHFTTFFQSIDWALLRKQKITLLEVIDQVAPVDEDNPDPQQKQWVIHLTGLLHLLDNLQDAAVESGLSESKIFGKQK